jgi:excisionase family DNA binding protein
MKAMLKPANEPLSKTSNAEADTSVTQELLRTYLLLSKGEREQRFVDTARAAELTGLSRRTIQFWVEIGAIKAVPIGRRYEIDLMSLTEYLSNRVERHAYK